MHVIGIATRFIFFLKVAEKSESVWSVPADRCTQSSWRDRQGVVYSFRAYRMHHSNYDNFRVRREGCVFACSAW